MWDAHCSLKRIVARINRARFWQKSYMILILFPYFPSFSASVYLARGSATPLPLLPMMAIEPVFGFVAFNVRFGTAAMCSCRTWEFASRLGSQMSEQTGVAGMVHFSKTNRRRDMLLVGHRIWLFALALSHRRETHGRTSISGAAMAPRCDPGPPIEGLIYVGLIPPC